MEVKTYLESIDIFNEIYKGSNFKVLAHSVYDKYISSGKSDLPDRILGYPINFAYIPSYQKVVWEFKEESREKGRYNYYQAFNKKLIPDRVERFNPSVDYKVYTEFFSLFNKVELEDVRKFLYIKSVEWEKLNGKKLSHRKYECQESWTSQGFIVYFESAVKVAIQSLSGSNHRSSYRSRR